MSGILDTPRVVVSGINHAPWIIKLDSIIAKKKTTSGYTRRSPALQPRMSCTSPARASDIQENTTSRSSAVNRPTDESAIAARARPGWARPLLVMVVTPLVSVALSVLLVLSILHFLAG